MPDRLTPPDPSQRGIAEAIDAAHFAAQRSAAGMRLCEERNRSRLPSGWWIAPLAVANVGAISLALWWLL